MTTKSDLSLLINSVWSGDPVESICNQILNYLSSERSAEIRHITTETLQKITENKFTDDTLLKAALYLSGKKPHLLEMQYLLIDDEDNEVVLSNKDLKEAKKSGSLIHPNTGEELFNYEDYLFFYFRPSKEAREITK